VLSKDDLLRRGLSVYYLEIVLLREMQHSDLNVEEATIYDLEDPRSKEHGLIRRKGANLLCPRDGKRGAAYVDAISDTFVGGANLMLSYTWRYRVKDIIDTLVAKCKTDNRDTKTTFVWICCFCNNQHRISETKNVSFDEFRETFSNTVTGVGTIWSMMSPWNNPAYLKRVWCIFEVYTAHKEVGCTAEIIMPEREKAAMISSLEDYNELYDVLGKTRIELAEASVDQDKKNILELVEKTVGFSDLNNKVNVLLREWIMGVLLSEAEKGDPKGKKKILDNATKLYHIATALEKMGNFDKSLELYNQCRSMREQWLDKDHLVTTMTYNKIGVVMCSKGDYESAMHMYQKCQLIQEKSLGKGHPFTAMDGWMDIDSSTCLLAPVKETFESSRFESSRVTATCMANENNFI